MVQKAVFQIKKKSVDRSMGFDLNIFLLMNYILHFFTQYNIT